jgi:hypothetical protein
MFRQWKWVNESKQDIKDTPSTKKVMSSNGGLVLSRLSIILSSSLAHSTHNAAPGVDFLVNIWRLGGLGGSNYSHGSFENSKSNSGNVNHNSKHKSSESNYKLTHSADSARNISESSHHNTTFSTCSFHPDPCAELQNSVNHSMVLFPLGIALIFLLVGAFPTLLSRSRYRVLGVRSCLWVLVELWVHLMISFIWFMIKEDRAQAYVWALHSSSHVLASWQPRKRVIPYPGLQSFASLVGGVCVSLFAWQFGPPVGLAAWNRRSDAQCGWAVHLTSVIGVELVEWVMGPLKWIVMGLD